MLNPRSTVLPRDARDTLFLLAVIAWVIMPQVGNLPVWCSLLAGGVLVWRGWLALTARPLPWQMVAARPARGHAGRHAVHPPHPAGARCRRDPDRRAAGLEDAGTARAPRCLRDLLSGLLHDAHQLLFLAVAAHRRRDADRPAGAADGAGQRAHAGGTPGADGRRSGRPAGWRCWARPSWLLLFVLFPRLAPAVGHSIRCDERAQRPVGHHAGRQHRRAWRSTAASPCASGSKAARPPQPDLYFRGPVLSSFDGREWRPLPPGLSQRMPAIEPVWWSAAPP